MKIAVISLLAISAAGASIPAVMGKETPASDADKLYALVKQARENVRETRKAAGLHPHAAGPHIDPEGHHVDDTPEQQRKERAEKAGHEDGGGEGHEGRTERGHEGGREGDKSHEGRERGEHGGGERREGGEQGGARIGKLEKHDKVYKNGARLILQYNPNTEAFVGSVENTTRRTLPEIRVEIHLSNGMELGPTKRVDLKPGKTIPVELGAFSEKFTSWVTHPESGVEAGHGPGGEGEEGGAGHAEREHGGRGESRGERGGHAERERGEHGGGGSERGDKPGSAKLHPVYNQILLLRGELKAFEADLAAKNKK